MNWKNNLHCQLRLPLWEKEKKQSFNKAVKSRQKDFLKVFLNKTAGYQGNNLRLPIFVKKAFKKMKTFQKKLILHPIFYFFPRSKFSDGQFERKTLLSYSSEYGAK